MVFEIIIGFEFIQKMDGDSYSGTIAVYQREKDFDY